jgi:hypothetical protein
MAFKLFSDVRETSATGGTGDQILTGAAFDASYVRFNDRYADTEQFFYCMKQGVLREIGLGARVAAGDKISRVQVYKSTNSNALVNFTNGQTIDIFVCMIAPQDLDAAGLALLNAALGSAGLADANTFTKTADATDATHGGACTIAGGLAVAKKLFVGTNAMIGGMLGVAGRIPSYAIDVSPGNATDRIRFGDIATTGSSIPVIEAFGARYDSNTSFGARFAAGFRRTDGTAIITSTNLGALAFGGQWGTDTSFQSAKMLYSASITGVSEGSFTSATAMATGLSFRTGAVGTDISAANSNYGTERMRIGSDGVVSISSTTISNSTNTGALTVGGGLGVVGNIYAGGNVVVPTNGGLMMNGSTGTTFFVFDGTNVKLIKSGVLVASW